ncbi:prephenate dehydrogenase/arogenate dehydrogenase family protein [Nitrosomonas sp.]|uniref:prephenate dehydrogenase n=1 Tax=Nitrosomonas sp. TaxID=42353 RepID=UPI0028412817|nr:prephenate dehydrogenase/arogenate dehydrogenase family protein [Nitrosomonas sp.]MDR4514677.1 prephenate dehydrogenase/arogenate dehydrogenase family protein [Nitrosomonas sp.]
MTHITLKKLVIIGVGLIGGSFALALRKAGIASYIVGVGRSRKNMQHALDLGVIDEIATDMASALRDADFVLLAMPVGQTENIMAQIAPHLETNTVISDAGSTKQDVVTAARNHLSNNLKNFVPGHPIAGAEYSGVLAAQDSLYAGKHVILTPIEETHIAAIEITTLLWQVCGAVVSQMPVEEHDETLAATSHLPHILAFALMNFLHNHSSQPENLLRFAGSGFRDFTRIASSSPEMWRDICLANREALLKQMAAYQQELISLQTILANKDGEALEKSLSQAREMREKWLNRNN